MSGDGKPASGLRGYVGPQDYSPILIMTDLAIFAYLANLLTFALRRYEQGRCREFFVDLRGQWPPNVGLTCLSGISVADGSTMTIWKRRRMYGTFGDSWGPFLNHEFLNTRLHYPTKFGFHPTTGHQTSAMFSKIGPHERSPHTDLQQCYGAHYHNAIIKLTITSPTESP